MTIDAPLDVRPAAVPSAAVNSLLTSPILPTLLKLALPNTIAMFGTTLVAVAETSYIGRLGTEPLAGDRAGVSLRHADADDVGGRDGRRRFLRDQPRARRRRTATAPRRWRCMPP